MKKSITILVLLLISVISVSAQSNLRDLLKSSESNFLYDSQENQATITFQNKSDYTMTIKILHLRGGLYRTFYLSPHSNQTISFGHTATYKLKIKAEHLGITSYHDGGNFSVTCTNTEWTEGTMSFSLSSYGSGLGTSISAKEFEKDY